MACQFPDFDDLIFVDYWPNHSFGEIHGGAGHTRRASPLFLGASVTTYLQPVSLPERCFLEEVLLWVAFQRLPIAKYRFDGGGREFREDEDGGGYEPEDKYDDRYLEPDECSRGGIPPDPTFEWLMSDKSTLPMDHYTEMLDLPYLDDSQRKDLESERSEAADYFRAAEEWAPKYEMAIEYPASRIFIALREGRLAATGRLLPAMEIEQAFDALHDEGLDFMDVPDTPIPAAFWVSKIGMDWAANSARNACEHYCWVRCRTEQMLAEFPGDDRQPVENVERIGSTFIVAEGTAGPQSRSLRPRGRPPFAWAPFHVEVTSLIVRGELPEKKEAAIQHFQDWFLRTGRKAPSRTAIGEKLKPYYDHFVRGGGN